MLYYIIAVGPLQCNTTLPVPPTNISTNATPILSTSLPPSDVTIVPASAVTIALIGVVLFILMLCICIQCCKGEDCGPCRAIIYCCNCLAILLLLGLIIAGSVLVFWPRENAYADCKLLDVPIATMALSYAFIISTCCCWVLCCCAVLGRVGSDQYDRV